MMVERHYDDEALLLLMEGDRFRFDAHIPSCTVCSGKLDTYRTITGALRHHDVWDKAEVRRDPVPATITNLRAFADRMSFEDKAAEAILPQLLAGSREEWMPRLMAHPEWRTAGVVRGLAGRACATTPNNPPNGLALAELCTEVAEHLDSTIVRADTFEKLRGAAWRERAYALFYVGRYTDALTAADRADAAFQRCVVDEYDRARVAIVRTLALRPKEELSAALASVRFSADVFARFEDAGRVVSASLAQSQIMFSRGDYESAIETLLPVERRLRDSKDARNHALVLNTLGSCRWKIGKLEEALVDHETAAMLYDALGIPTEAARNRWNVALILMLSGRGDDARPRLESLRSTFSGLGMTSEATLVSLDLAELHLARDRFDDVETICHAAMRSLEAAGLSYTSRALTALAYIREAAQRRAVTPVAVKHVRDYIRRLPRDGQLLFAPPVEPEFSNSR